MKTTIHRNPTTSAKKSKISNATKRKLAVEKREATNKKIEAVVKVKKPAKPAKEKKPARVDTGYCAMIRKLLHGGKHTIDQAARAILEQYPEKDIKSVKRVAANLCKRERKATQNFELKWVPSAVTGTGYMARIDELLGEGKLTTRQIGETVAKEFEKEETSAKRVTRARLRRLRKAGKKLNIPLESQLREEELARNPKPAKQDQPKKSKEIAKAKAKGDAKRTGGKDKKKAAPVKAAKTKPAKKSEEHFGTRVES